MYMIHIITLEEVIAPREHTAFQDALLVSSSNYIRDFFGDWVNTLQNDAHTKAYSEDNKLTCPRYWHGFVLFLKPMFVFFNLGETYQINTLIRCALCFTTLLLIHKKDKAYVGSFLVLLSFLDFLTYPPIAFVVPLCYVLVFSEQDLLHNLLASIRYGIAFLLGYAGMWVSKWILASLFTDENVIAEGIE